MRTRGFVAWGLLVLITGCGDDAPPTSNNDPALPPPPPPAAPVADDAGDESAVAAASDAEPAPKTKTDKRAPKVISQKKAEVGIGERSQRIKGAGYFPTVIRSRHRMEESLQLSQATHALQLYKALNGGVGPKTHEEYMQKVIKENHVKLPKLPEGQQYLYDPEKEELWVVELAPEEE